MACLSLLVYILVDDLNGSVGCEVESIAHLLLREYIAFGRSLCSEDSLQIERCTDLRTSAEHEHRTPFRHTHTRCQPSAGERDGLFVRGNIVFDVLY